MRNLLHITIWGMAMAISPTAFPQVALEWERCIGGPGSDYLKGMATTTDGGFLAVGYTESMGGNIGDSTALNGGAALLIKLDATGHVVWSRTVGHGGTGSFSLIEMTGEGNYFVVGRELANDSNSTAGHHGLYDAWILLFEPDGNMLWQKFLGGSSVEEITAMQQTSDQGFILAGTTQSTDGNATGNTDDAYGNAWVVKLDATGEIEWQHNYGGSGVDVALSIAQTPEGGYIFTGSTTSDDGDVTGHHGDGVDAWVVKLDALGGIEWQRPLGGVGSETGKAIAPTDDGGYLLAAIADQHDGDVGCVHVDVDYDLWMVELDSDGSIVQQRCLGYPNSQIGGDFSLLKEDGGGWTLSMALFTYDEDIEGYHGDFDIRVLSLDEHLEPVWERILGGAGQDMPGQLIRLEDGTYVGVGSTLSNDGDVTDHHGGFDAWAFKLNAGTLGISDMPRHTFILSPNPSSGQFQISFPNDAVPERVVVRDPLGRQVLEQVVRDAAGMVWIDLRGHATGLYGVDVHFADGTRAMQRLVKE